MEGGLHPRGSACRWGGLHPGGGGSRADPYHWIPRDMVNERVVRFILECILVLLLSYKALL